MTKLLSAIRRLLLSVPVFVKIATPLIIMLVVVVGISGLLVYNESNANLIQDADLRLKRVAIQLASRIDPAQLETIQTPADSERPEYSTIRDLMSLAREAGGLSWVGLYRMEDGFLSYSVDSDDTGIGYPFFAATPEHLATFSDGQVRNVSYSDEFGAYHAALAPVYQAQADGSQKIIGIIEASVSQEARRLVRQETFNRVLPLLLAGTALAVAFSLGITHVVLIRPIRRLQSGALSLAAGDLGHTIDMDTGDEIGRLADAFNVMSARIQTLIREQVEMERSQREKEILALQENERILSARVAERTTELAAKNEELIMARDMALDASRAKSEFLANMSHEIRTPMNAIIGMTGLLLDTPLNVQQRDFVETVRISGDTLLAIINDILDFSKIEANKIELEQHPFDLRECVESALDLVATRAAEKRLDLVSSIEAGLPISFNGDQTRLRQILINLLSNAVKFTEKGEVMVSVRREGENERTGALILRFSVQDSGIGIPPDRTHRLFQSFSQVDASTTRKYGGTGLGLAISKRLVEMQGGKIWVESEPGKGSAFHFTVQLPPIESPRPVHLQSEQPELRGKRVLVVDDNPTNRKILTLQLQSWGVQPISAASGPEALALIVHSEPFDLGVLDMQMPEMDGLMLGEALHRQPQTTNLPLVMLTSLGWQDPDVRVKEFSAFLTKPVKASQLYNCLLEVLTLQGIPHPHQTIEKTPIFEASLAERFPLRILLAEDNATNIKVALLILDRLGYRADVAGNGMEVLKSLRQVEYDLILMDVQMPEMDGLQATRAVRSEYPIEKQPAIVAMTASALKEDRDACLAAGMDDYIGKPVQIQELTAALENAYRRRHRPQPSPELPAQPVVTQSSDTPVINPAALRQLRSSLGKKADLMLPALVENFKDDVPELLNMARLAVKEKDQPGLRRAAHTIKSTAATFGALAMSEAARRLEKDCESTIPLNAAAHIDQIEAEFHLAGPALDKALAQ